MNYQVYYPAHLHGILDDEILHERNNVMDFFVLHQIGKNEA